jgi:surface-anchored protein
VFVLDKTTECEWSRFLLAAALLASLGLVSCGSQKADPAEDDAMELGSGGKPSTEPQGGQGASGGEPSASGGARASGGATGAAGEPGAPLAGMGNLGGQGGEANPGGLDPDEAECPYRYTEGHGDLYVTYDLETGLGFGLRSAFKNSAFKNSTGESGAGETVQPLTSACLIVGLKAMELSLEYGGAPAGSDFAFLGIPAEDAFWLLPQVARTGLPWFGLSTEGVPRTGLGERVQLSLRAIEVPDRAKLSVWSTDTFGRPAVLWSTYEQTLSAELNTGVHAHFNWAFTEPGHYSLEFTANMTGAADSPPVPSKPGVLRVVVEP